MAFLRPDADDTDGGWTTDAGGTSLFPAVDETTAIDTDYIQSPVNPSAATCRLSLSNPVGTPIEPFVVRYRIENAAGLSLNVRLVEGASTVIAAWDEAAAASFTTIAHTLTTPQFNDIGDFTNLFVEFTANVTAGDPTLVLDLDFTTGTLDSKVTFWRMTAATRVNASGLIVSEAIDAARFDHDPVTLLPRGLLIEEQRTNIVTHSQNFASGTWNATAGSFTGYATATPDGTTTGATLTAGGNAIRFFPTAGATVTSGIPYAMSYFVKKGTANFAILNLYTTGNTRAWFNLTTGAVATVPGGHTATITAFPGGWYRLTLSGTTGAITAYAVVEASDADNSIVCTTGNTLFVWGGQLEAGGFATSYIPTTTAPVTRAADGAVITGLWTPVDLAVAPMVWMDAQETGTITHASGAVSAVTNNGSLGGSLVQATGTLQPAYSATGWDGTRPAISYVDDALSMLVSHTGNRLGIFFVAETSGGPGGRLVNLRGTGGGTEGWTSPSFTQISRSSATHWQNSRSPDFPSFAVGDAKHLVGVVHGAAGLSARTDGGTATTNAVATNFATVLLVIGGEYNDTSGDSIVGKIPEVIILGYEPTTGEREQIEGYLAHRWGIAANLPSGHTYKSAAPTAGSGTNFSSWWNASAGTFVVVFDGPANGTRAIVAVDDISTSEVIMLYGSGTDPKAIVTDGGATQADLDAGTLVANTVSKLGLSFAANDFAACLNGGTVATDTGGTLPTVTQARLGSGPAGNYLNGHLASLKFYNVAKTDADLVTLTT